MGFARNLSLTVATQLASQALAVLTGRTLDRRYWLPLIVSLGISHGFLFAVLQP